MYLCVYVFVSLCAFQISLVRASESFAHTLFLLISLCLAVFFIRPLYAYTHTQTHTETYTHINQDCTEQGIACSLWLLCFLSVRRRGRRREQNKAPCFVLHLLSVAPKKKPLGASPPYALYIPLIPLCHYVCSDFLDKRFWTERQMKCWEAGC